MDRLYTLLCSAAAPLLRLHLLCRARRGKEDPARLSERFGQTTYPQPEGPLVWLHAASVGETRAALVVADILRTAPSPPTVLLTTGTTNAARMLAQTGALDAPDLIHQYAPLDVQGWVLRFLDHWQPNMAVFLESELWPTSLRTLRARAIPAFLVNARLSERSARTWRIAPGLIRTALAAFDTIFAQNATFAARFTALGADPQRVMTVGNLKDDAPPPTPDPDALARLQTALADRPVWLAASSHEAEEALILDTHARLRQRFPTLLTLIAPRQPDRGAPLFSAAADRALSPARRALGHALLPETQVYIADTLGEMGLFYAACPVCVIGKSLLADGGQNPAEAIALDCAVVMGPHMRNFADLAHDLQSTEGARCVPDPTADTLADAVADLLSDPQARAQMASRARACLAARAGARAALTRPLLEALHAATDSPNAPDARPHG